MPTIQSLIKSALFAALAGAMLVQPALGAAGADPAKALQQAQRLFAEKKYEEAHAAYLQQGENNPLAQFMLGMFEQQGWGRPVEPEAACRWFERAAAGHVPAAEHFFAGCLDKGIGRASDPSASLHWYEQAAAHGHLISWCDVGELYVEGRGVPRNPQHGQALCQQVAQAGSPPAMLRLAHWSRPGGPLDNSETYLHWLQKAAEYNNPEAQFELGQLLSVAARDDTMRAQAVFWTETAAANGHVPAYLATAVAYANAPVQPDTKVLAPEHLAKIYLWTGASRARASDAGSRQQIARIDAMLSQVVPAGWRAELDRKIAEHLDKYPAP